MMDKNKGTIHMSELPLFGYNLTQFLFLADKNNQTDKTILLTNYHFRYIFMTLCYNCLFDGYKKGVITSNDVITPFN